VNGIKKSPKTKRDNRVALFGSKSKSTSPLTVEFEALLEEAKVFIKDETRVVMLNPKAPTNTTHTSIVEHAHTHPSVHAFL
jgi:hypothetical protein